MKNTELEPLNEKFEKVRKFIVKEMNAAQIDYEKYKANDKRQKSAWIAGGRYDLCKKLLNEFWVGD